MARIPIIGTFVTLARTTARSPWPWILAFALALLRNFLAAPGIPHNGDLAYPASLPRYVDHFYPLWDEHTSVSNLENVDRLLVALPLAWAAGPLGGIGVLAKALVLVPLVVSGITAAALCGWVLREATPDRVPRPVPVIAGSFLYMISPWVLEQLQAPFFWLAYAVTPGILLLTLRGLRGSRPWDALGVAVLWSVASGSPHYTIFTGVLVAFLALIHVIHGSPDGPGAGQRLLRAVRFLAMAVAPYLAINAYWILPSSVAALGGTVSPGYAFTPDQLIGFSARADLANIFAGTDQAIRWYQPAGGVVALEYSMAVTTPLILVLAFVILGRAGRAVPSFHTLVLVFLAAAGLSLGYHNPLYAWLALDAPLTSTYGWLFRVPGKISYLLWPTYAVALAVVMEWALGGLAGAGLPRTQPRPPGPWRKVATLGLVALLTVPVAGFAGIKANDYFSFYYRPLEVPAPYQQAFQYLGGAPNVTRVADLAPYDQGLLRNNLTFESSLTWNPNRIAGYFVPRSLPGPSVGFYHFTFSEAWRPAYENFAFPVTNSSPAWLGAYGVSEVLYHNDVVGAQDVGAREMGNLTSAGLTLERQYDYITIYRVPQPLGRLYPLPAQGTYGKYVNAYPCVEAFVNATGCFGSLMANLTWTYGMVLVPTQGGPTGQALRMYGLSKDQGDWLQVPSDPFPVTSNLVEVSLWVRQVSAEGSRVGVEGRDDRGTWTSLVFSPGGVRAAPGWLHYTSTIKVPETVHTLRLRLQGGWRTSGATDGEVDFADVRVAQLGASVPGLGDVARSGVALEGVNHPETTRWSLDAHAAAPFRLVFTEAYDPYWSLRVTSPNGTVDIAPAPFLDSIQVYAVNATGSLRLDLTYRVQAALDLGIWITLAALGALGLTVAVAVGRRFGLLRPRSVRGQPQAHPAAQDASGPTPVGRRTKGK